MTDAMPRRRLLSIAFLFFVTACGGGGSGSSGQPTGSNPPGVSRSYINLSSDAGDYVGAGKDYTYSKANAEINVRGDGARLTISIVGDERWVGQFELPDGFSELQPGSYPSLERYSSHDPAVGGLSWSGEARGCIDLTGWLIIDSVTYDGTFLTGIDFQFEQHCEDSAAALHGEAHWHANDATSPAGPVFPVPASLWEPAANVTPLTGSYVYLDSQPGDYIGGGEDYLYTETDSRMSFDTSNGRFSVYVDGNERWSGDFQVMNVISGLEVGYYGGLQHFPTHNPVKGGLNWTGENRLCDTLTGWFAVDEVIYNGSTATAVDLRFEQRCEVGGPALHGKIHWDVADETSPSGPVSPPADLWEPVEGTTPGTGNYIYVEGQVGLSNGGSGSYLYTPANSQITVDSSRASLNVGIRGDESWDGHIQGMDFLNRLEVGYYGDLQRYPYHNPVKGGLHWSRGGSDCDIQFGWFVVDSVTYDGTTLTAIDLRFEQPCEGGTSSLRGAMHWNANDTTSPPGPVVPAPPGLWEPAGGVTPATGSYVYLESQPGDVVGLGNNYLYTFANSMISVNAVAGRVSVYIEGDEYWNSNFAGMNFLSRVEVGYYGNLKSYPLRNPVIGGLEWLGGSSTCEELTGWFVVDSVTYDGSNITAIDFRFEQRCEGDAPALHGKIHWDVTDTASPPGPIVPPPPGLWRPAGGITPDTENYVYLESQPEDYIGSGLNYLYTPADSQITVSSNGARVDISVNGNESWSGSFEGMRFLSRAEAGYYGDLKQHRAHNPAKGGLIWFGDGRACIALTGWFVVDDVTYNGFTLTAIDLRFEQHCEGADAALHGAIHWRQ